MSVRLDNELKTKLESIAKSLSLSKGHITRQALEVYLYNLEEELNDYNDAMQILAEQSPTTSWKDVQRKCDLEN